MCVCYLLRIRFERLFERVCICACVCTMDYSVFARGVVWLRVQTKEVESTLCGAADDILAV